MKTASKRPSAVKSVNKIVGIGASAGGLEAFTELLRGLSVDADVAYVLVQHLDPSHRSLLSELLAKATAIQVREILDNTRVEANQIYVIPPNCDLAIEQGVLKLSPREKTGGPARSIDNFLTSLATDQKSNAIAVILSGAGSDGAQGLKAVKEAGGITFAQDDRTAKYDSMPRAAIATGCVDFVLPPPDIAKELARVVMTPGAVHSRAAANAKRRRSQSTNSRVRFGRRSASMQVENWPMLPEEPSLRRIFQLLRAKTGLDFTFYKTNTIHRRLARRLALNKVKELEDYVKILRHHPTELEALHQDLLIKVTSFFRNPRVFEALKRKVFPKLVKNLSNTDTLRIWVAGCSTGQEAYSLAMAYAEFAETAEDSVPIQIFASDVNGLVLEFARAACYSKADVSMVGSKRLQKFFNIEEGHYRVQKRIRDMVIFAQHNLLQDPPFTRVDLITCRNMMIYFESALQQKIIPAFHYALKPDGFLVLGSSESVGQFHHLFNTVEKTQRIYSKKPASNWPRFDRPPTILSKKEEQRAPRHIVEISAADVQKEADRLVLQKYSPPGVLINGEGEVLQFRGDMAPYLNLPTGKATFQIMKLAKDGLAIPMERAIAKAKREHRVAREKGVRVDSRRNLVDIEVVPLKLKAQCYLVLFEKREARQTVKVVSFSRKNGRMVDESRQLGELKEELTSTRDHLHSLQEEHDTSIEELQASNEEVQSANEELQSLNEELETSNEELESANEELTTLNEELATRNAELRESELRLREQAQLLEMAPLLARSPKDRIVLWSRGAEQMYGFSAEEAIGQTAHILLDTQTSEPISKIQTKLQQRGHWEGEVTHRRKDGTVLHVATQWVVQLDDHKRIRTILEVNSNISERKAAEKALADSEEFNRTVLESSPDCIKVLDLDGRIVYVNPVGRRLMEAGDSEERGKPYWPGLWEGDAREAAEKAYRSALAGKGGRFVGFRTTPRGTPKWWDVVVRPISGEDGRVERLLAVLRDVTDHRAEQAAISERSRMTALRAEVATETTGEGSMQAVLQRVAEALHKCLELALVRVWSLETGTGTLLLRASAGIRTDIHGPQSEVPVGNSTIGQVAEIRKASINNHLKKNGHHLDADWLRKEELTSFGAYPLMMGDTVVGVLAVYGRQPLSDAMTGELVLASRILAQFIQRKKAEEKLRSAQEELSRYTDSLEKLTEERTASLREVVQQMEEFSYTISHDLRAPVRAMQGYATALLEDYGNQLDTPGREYLERIVRSGDRMDRMIREVLTYSRLSRCDIKVQPVALDSLVREIVQQYPLIQKSGGEIEIAEKLDSVVGHEPSLTQVLSNLLSNACKFVPPKEKPCCQVWTERQNGNVRLYVRDNGIGIKPEHQHRLFGLFERIHPESEYEGTGIGLAIVRKAMERMGGQVGVESDGVHGSKFWIELPAVKEEELLNGNGRENGNGNSH